MTGHIERIAQLIDELSEIQNSQSVIPEQDEKLPLPVMIPAPNAGSIIISRNIENIILNMGQDIKHNMNLNKRFSNKEWDNAAKAAFGQALSKIDLDDESYDNARLVFDKVKNVLSQYEQKAHEEHEHAFGCTFLNIENIQLPEIGPVKLERREDWLLRKKNSGAISAIAYRRILKSWQGGKLRKRKASRDSLSETEILEAIKSCPYVCTVETEGLARNMSHEKALIAARLFMAAISLVWLRPSHALSGLNLLYDGPIHRQISLTFDSKGSLFSGLQTSHLPHAPYTPQEEWKQALNENEYVFNVVGGVIDSYLKPLKEDSRASMNNVLFHALLWFHEGCRESNEMLAIVKFASAMDALACGKKKKGILKLINNQLGKKKTDQLFKDGTTSGQFINKIYNHARSRTLHGTNKQIDEEWGIIRLQAEQLTRLCMLSCLEWLAQNPKSDNPEDLIDDSAST